jgi:hypothetical protein
MVNQQFILKLIRLGIEASKGVDIPHDINWSQIKTLAEELGLNAIVLDGIESLPE